ncbi:MAG: hypothetical protein ACI9VR_005148 [Cognaticolwellia sp.]|jgi:hypothetical protein
MLIFLSLLSCSDYGLFGDRRDAPAGGLDSDPLPESEAPIPDEVCNGEDDDLDGDIDEGSPDTDGDGIADCIDDACEVTVPLASILAPNEDCDGWVPEVKTESPWEWEIEFHTYLNVATPTPPSIGGVADTNSDGVITRADTTVIAHQSGSMGSDAALPRCYYHVTGQEECAMAGLNAYASSWRRLFLADVTGDGEIEYLQTAGNLQGIDSVYTTAYLPDGEIWRDKTIDPLNSCLYNSAADLDGDGLPEVLGSRGVVNGATGEAIWSYFRDDDQTNCAFAADLDGDGYQEVMAAGKVFDYDGTLLFELPDTVFTDVFFGWDMDGDGQGEVVISTYNELQVYERDGTLSDTITLDEQLTIQPCIADFDGDGTPEIAILQSHTTEVRELTGGLLWRTSSGPKGGRCAAADFDGDGAFELVKLDFYNAPLNIHNGADGTILLSIEPPEGVLFGDADGDLAIADIDNDNSVEIVIGGGSISVIGHPDNGWTEGTASWRSNMMTLSNPLPDGSIPAPPAPPRAARRLNAQRQAELIGSADLLVANLDVCVASCEGEGAQIAFQLGNAGPLPIASVDLVILLTDNITGETTELHRFEDQSVGAHSLEPGLVFQTHGYLLRDQQVSVRVDPEDTVKECSEGNNLATWEPVLCEGY